MKIITVMRSGGEYRAEHVERLAQQCARFVPGVEFRCLSDDRSVPGYRPLKHNWPGWWAKIEAFRFRGPVLYMDLDTTLRGTLTPLLAVARERPFVTLRDFNAPMREVQSSVMAWRGDMRRLYTAFRRKPAAHMQANNCGRWWGDQGFIERQMTKREYWQDLLPGTIVSWKKHCDRGVAPDGARVVVFHGRPRPWEVAECL